MRPLLLTAAVIGWDSWRNPQVKMKPLIHPQSDTSNHFKPKLINSSQQTKTYHPSSSIIVTSQNGEKKKKKIWNRNDCQRSQTRPKLIKRSKERYLSGQKHNLHIVGVAPYKMTLKSQLNGEKWCKVSKHWPGKQQKQISGLAFHLIFSLFFAV